MLDELIDKIKDNVPEVIFDYSFLTKLKKKKEDYDEKAISFLNFISENGYDYNGNRFDFRILDSDLQIPEEDIYLTKKTTDFTIIAGDKLKINLDYVMKLNSQNFDDNWSLLRNCNVLSINKGDSGYRYINSFWSDLFKEYKSFRYKWLIIIEPYLFGKGSKDINVNEIAKVLKSEKCFIIYKDIDSIEKPKDKICKMTCKEEPYKDKYKKLHDRIIITNYFIMRSGHSFDYFDNKKKKIKVTTSVVVTSIINDFESIRNNLKYIRSLNN